MYKKFLIIFKYFLFIALFIRTYCSYQNNIFTMFFLLFLITLLIINDYVRSTKLTITFENVYDLSLIFTIIGSIILRYFIVGSEANSYIFFALIELLGLKGTRLKKLFLVHFLLFFTLIIVDMGLPLNWDKISCLGSVMLSYLAIAYTSYSVNVIQREKQEVNNLNEKLQQYILEIEELTASKERAIMAQELHDSVGHFLMALIMNLEFAKNICDKKPHQVKKTLIKCEDITRSSISSLREAVNLLKEERETKSFNSYIYNIIDNFHLINNIEINFNTNEILDNLTQNIKNSIYKTIKEFITNSIKHGQATEINIEISKNSNNLIAVFKNNGIRCDKIIKSNGLLGIENRVHLLNGSLNYFSNNNFGFGINIVIPILTEEV